eukprot:scaffold124435_cov37-Prasinocladus_malaysianus.AAC.1
MDDPYHHHIVVRLFCSKQLHMHAVSQLMSCLAFHLWSDKTQFNVGHCTAGKVYLAMFIERGINKHIQD